MHEVEFVPGVVVSEKEAGPGAEAEDWFGLGSGPEVGAAPAHAGDAVGIAERPVVDTGSNFDKAADKGHIQDTAGSIADTVADTTVPGLALQQKPQHAPEN